jgi:hypothetical protein
MAKKDLRSNSQDPLTTRGTLAPAGEIKMSQNHISPLWSVNKATVFIDAVDLATKSSKRAARYQRTAPSPKYTPNDSLRPQRLLFGLTPQRMAVALALILISSLTAASWIV